MTKDVAKYVKASHNCHIAKTNKHLVDPMIVTETPS